MLRSSAWLPFKGHAAAARANVPSVSLPEATTQDDVLNAKPPDIDAYLSTVPDDARATPQGLRQTIKDLVPDAVEMISYGLPT